MSVQSEKLLQIISDVGLEAEPQSAFYKVACGNRAVYVAKTQKVARVDLSGFDVKHPAVKRISADEARELKLGRIRGQIDFSKNEDRVLEAFRTCLEMMKHLAEVPDTDSDTGTQAKKGNKAKRKKAIRGKVEERRAERNRARTRSAEDDGAEANA